MRTFAWNSNPGHKHGRYVCCRYTKGAFVHGMSWICFPIQKTTLLANALISFWGIPLTIPLTSFILSFVSFSCMASVSEAPATWVFGLSNVRKVLGSILSTSLDSFCSCLDQCFAFPRYFTQFFAPIFRLRQLACSWVLQLHVQLVGLSFF